MLSKCQVSQKLTFLLFYYILFYLMILFLYREGEGGRTRGRETSMCGCLSHPPYWGPVQQLMCPRLGIEPVTFWFAGRHSIHRATPARQKLTHFKIDYHVYPHSNPVRQFYSCFIDRYGELGKLASWFKFTQIKN